MIAQRLWHLITDKVRFVTKKTIGCSDCNDENKDCCRLKTKLFSQRYPKRIGLPVASKRETTTQSGLCHVRGTTKPRRIRRIVHVDRPLQKGIVDDLERQVGHDVHDCGD